MAILGITDKNGSAVTEEEYDVILYSGGVNNFMSLDNLIYMAAKEKFPESPNIGKFEHTTLTGYKISYEAHHIDDAGMSNAQLAFITELDSNFGMAVAVTNRIRQMLTDINVAWEDSWYVSKLYTTLAGHSCTNMVELYGLTVTIVEAAAEAIEEAKE